MQKKKNHEVDKYNREDIFILGLAIISVIISGICTYLQLTLFANLSIAFMFIFCGIAMMNYHRFVKKTGFIERNTQGGPWIDVAVSKKSITYKLEYYGAVIMAIIFVAIGALLLYISIIQV